MRLEGMGKDEEGMDKWLGGHDWELSYSKWLEMCFT